MKFVLNAKNIDTPAALVCIRGLAHQLEKCGYEVALNDWDNYHYYDVIIIMSKDSNYDLIKKINPNILYGLADPKTSCIEQAKKADFCIVSSIEQREAFLSINRNIFIYYMIPEFDFTKIIHKDKKITKIVYHGNKVHLNAAYLTLIPALNEISKSHSIQFDVIFNLRELGSWTFGRPKNNNNFVINELQWYPNCYIDYFKDADIGVVPNYIPVRNYKLIKYLGTISTKILLEEKNDYLNKYKPSTNAGRIFVFGYFGIPVIAEAVPSACDALIDQYSGRLVLNKFGWYEALEALIISKEERNKLSSNFNTMIAERFSPEVSTNRLVDYLNNIKPKNRIKIETIKISVIKELKNFYIFKLKRKVNTLYEKFFKNL
jgi:glycosyltransferase involved in cell wall biosynthesis